MSGAREEVLNNFIIKLFPTKKFRQTPPLQPTPKLAIEPTESTPEVVRKPTPEVAT